MVFKSKHACGYKVYVEQNPRQMLSYEDDNILQYPCIWSFQTRFLTFN